MRPTFTPPTDLPAFIAERMVAKANASWCYVTDDGRAFYVTQAKAEAMLASDGTGTVYPPIA
jgi:hypothetical protein